MKLSGNTVLITGGATGIGLAMAEAYMKAGSEVIICGRREGRLLAARERHPELHTRTCDVVSESDCRALRSAWSVVSPMAVARSRIAVARAVRQLLASRASQLLLP